MTDSWRRLQQAIPEALSAQECDALLSKARADAITEVGDLLRLAFREQLLEDVLARLHAADDGAASEAAAESAALPADDVAALQAEIETIQGRLAENERHLSMAVRPPAVVAEVVSALSTPSSGASEGWYMYGVVQTGSASGAVLPEEGVAPGYPVYLVEDGDLAAIVSRVPLDDFGEAALEANMKNLAWIETKVRGHHAVLTHVLAADSGLVPMRFCTIYHSEGRVLEVLAHNREQFHAALARVSGRNEWGVKLSYDRKAALTWADEHGDSVAALRHSIGISSAGAAYFLQKRVDEVLSTEAERAVDQAAQAIHETLTSGVAESQLLAVQEADATCDTVMVMNAAYLLDDGAAAAFEATLSGLVEQHSALGFVVEWTGPWPAYNFLGAPIEGMAA